MNRTASGPCHDVMEKWEQEIKRGYVVGISCSVGVGPGRTPPFGSLPGTSKWEEIQNTLEGFDCMSHLAWGRLGIPGKNWESVASKRDIWNARLAPGSYTSATEIGWWEMDGWKMQPCPNWNWTFQSHGITVYQEDVTISSSFVFPWVPTQKTDGLLENSIDWENYIST